MIDDTYLTRYHSPLSPFPLLSSPASSTPSPSHPLPLTLHPSLASINPTLCLSLLSSLSASPRRILCRSVWLILIEHATVDDLDLDAVLGLAAVGPDVLDLLDNVIALDHRGKHHVLPVQVPS